MAGAVSETHANSGQHVKVRAADTHQQQAKSGSNACRSCSSTGRCRQEKAIPVFVIVLPTEPCLLQLPSSRHDAHQEYQARQCTQELQRHRETQAEKAIPAHRRFFCPNAACSRVLARRGTSSRVTCPTCRAVVRCFKACMCLIPVLHQTTACSCWPGRVPAAT